MLLQVTADDTGCILHSRLDSARNGMGVAPILPSLNTGSDEPATLGTIGDGKVWGRCIRVYCELDERSDGIAIRLATQEHGGLAAILEAAMGALFAHIQ